VSSVRSPRSTGPPPSPVAMAIRRSCGPQLIDFYNLLHHHGAQHSAADLAVHFTTKIENVRSATINAPPPVIDLRQSTTFADLVSVSVEEAAKLLKSTPNQHCQLDPIPTWILKKSADRFAPLFAALCNSSHSSMFAPISETCLGISPSQDNYDGSR